MAFIVGAPGWNDTGIAYVFSGNMINTNNLGSPRVLYPDYLNKSQGRFGSAIDAADFDLDGRSDVAISNPSRTATNQTAVYVYRGTASLSLGFWQKLLGGPTLDGFGTAITFGNMLADSKTGVHRRLELAVGSPNSVSHGSRGAVFLHAPETFAGSDQVANFKLVQVIYSQFNEAADFGSALHTADVYSPSVSAPGPDGFDDLFIGAPRQGGGNGRVSIYSVSDAIKTSLHFWDTLTRPANARLFGRAVATGALAALPTHLLPGEDGVSVPNVYVGAPRSDVEYPIDALNTGVEPDSGAVFGYSVDAPYTFGPNGDVELHQGSSSPW